MYLIFNERVVSSKKLFIKLFQKYLIVTTAPETTESNVSKTAR